MGALMAARASTTRGRLTSTTTSLALSDAASRSALRTKVTGPTDAAQPTRAAVVRAGGVGGAL
ncbi:MAG: hypothetical protein M3083_16450 [Actinomycetota bacterium]|nr:hypothetical protein [Actinomycetota bacterium]